MNRYAFISSEYEVRQIISGDLDPSQLALFERDYAKLFGTTSVVTVEDEATQIWIGGSYDSDSGTFSPPPTTEPESIVVDAPIEVIEEILPE